MQRGALFGLEVVITRPRLQSDLLKQLILSEDGLPVIFPTLEIHSSNHSQMVNELQNIHQYDIVIFTSKNAVYSIGSLFPLDYSGKIAAMGPGTAKALSQYKIPVSALPIQQFNSEHLLALPLFKKISNKNILIFKGQGGRTYLQDQLKKRKAQVTEVYVYERKCPNISVAMLERITQLENPIVISTSCESLQNFVNIMISHLKANWLFQTPIVIISERMRQFALEIGFQDNLLHLADNATEQAILECLVRIPLGHL